MKRIACLAIAIAAVASHAAGSAAPPEGPRVYALVSAIGSTLQYVKPRFTTGTHRDEFQRAELTVPDVTLDMAALRGLEATIRANDPSATVEYLRLDPNELKGLEAPKKGPAAAAKVASALSRFPGRERWYQVLVVTPRHVANEREGMGSKLQGIGIYVQNLEKGVIDASGSFGDIADTYETVKPDGSKVEGRTTAYVAPFFYASVWVLDGQTLETIKVTERFDLVRVADPDSSANRIENAIPPEALGPLVEAFVQKAAEKAAREAIGVVTVGEPKVVKPD